MTAASVTGRKNNTVTDDDMSMTSGDEKRQNDFDNCAMATLVFNLQYECWLLAERTSILVVWKLL